MQGCGVGRSRRFSEGVGVGMSSRLGVGVGIFYPTPTPHVQFLYVLVMLTAQLTRSRASGVQCSNLFKRTLPRIARHSLRLIKSSPVHVSKSAHGDPSPDHITLPLTYISLVNH